MLLGLEDYEWLVLIIISTITFIRVKYFYSIKNKLDIIEVIDGYIYLVKNPMVFLATSEGIFLTKGGYDYKGVVEHEKVHYKYHTPLIMLLNYGVMPLLTTGFIVWNMNLVVIAYVSFLIITWGMEFHADIISALRLKHECDLDLFLKTYISYSKTSVNSLWSLIDSHPPIKFRIWYLSKIKDYYIKNIYSNTFSFINTIGR